MTANSWEDLCVEDIKNYDIYPVNRELLFYDLTAKTISEIIKNTWGIEQSRNPNRTILLSMIMQSLGDIQVCEKNKYTLINETEIRRKPEKKLSIEDIIFQQADQKWQLLGKTEDISLIKNLRKKLMQESEYRQSTVSNILAKWQKSRLQL